MNPAVLIRPLRERPLLARSDRSAPRRFSFPAYLITPDDDAERVALAVERLGLQRINDFAFSVADERGCRIVRREAVLAALEARR